MIIALYHIPLKYMDGPYMCVCIYVCDKRERQITHTEKERDTIHI